jgi:hypothetical protein
MGFIPLEDAHIHNAPNGIEKLPTDANGRFSSFQVAHLASEQTTTPTGMKEEIVLLSWLMVLLRSREDSQISYDWSYKDVANDVQPASVSRLVMNEVMKGLQSNVGEVATAISRNITTGASSPASLVLSTSSLSRTSEEAKDDVSEQLNP